MCGGQMEGQGNAYAVYAISLYDDDDDDDERRTDTMKLLYYSDVLPGWT